MNFSPIMIPGRWVATATVVALACSAVAQERANPKAPAKLQPSLGDRKIEALDTIFVNVFGEPEFKGGSGGGLELRVSSSGTITLFLLGSVKVIGKTPAEAEGSIREKLMDGYIRDPHVLVQVKEYRTHNVTIMGQVSNPGLIALPPEQRYDILMAIAQAGGFTKLARKSKIEVNRKGVKEIFEMDELKKVVDPAEKFWIEPDDLIYVHPTTF